MLSTDEAINTKVEALLQQMTIEEKVGQLTLYTADYGATGPSLREEYLAGIKAGKIGAIFNAITGDFIRKLQQVAIEDSRLKIPLLFGFDVIHGYKTIFPIPLAEAATWNLAAIEKSARIAAIEASAAGLHWTFAPMVDIARDPRWGRIAEGAGEDPYLGSLIARARVQGFQGNDLAATDTILACAKHFAGYGAAEAGRDYNTVDLSQRVLREIYLKPFQAATDAGVATFMTSFNELDGIPCTGNRQLLTEILRNEWRFNGFVVTDYTSIAEMIAHGIAANPAQAGKLALDAGVDMDMQSGIFSNELPKLVKHYPDLEKMIDEAVRRILRLKFKLGLFDNPYAYSDAQRERDKLLAKDHLDAALDVAKKAIVLLKNDRKTLPLPKNLSTLAVIGPLADNQKELLGSWSGAGDPKDVVTLLSGIKAKLTAQTNVLYAPGCSITDSSRSNFDLAIRMAQQADAVIVALGEEALMSGEAASRADLNLPGVQEELLQALHATGKPIILVLMNGRPLTINWASQNVAAILECWFLGTQSGHAIASVIFGEANPSGKLPVSFPRSVGQIPIYYNHKNTGRPFDKDNKYTSKYLDIENTPLYPFGYGLSYTTFEYANLRLGKAVIQRSENLNVAVEVKNTGAWEGTETVQLYLRDEVGSVTRPVKELKRFAQVTLASGAVQTVTFTLTPQDLSCYDRAMKFSLEPGFFQVMVGTNSAEVISARFEVVE